MKTRAGIRGVLGALAASSVATVAVVAFTVTPARADTSATVCTLLPILCPPTTKPKPPPTTSPPTTTAPAATTAPTAAATHASTARTTAKSVSAAPAKKAAPASVGTPGLLLPASGALDLPADNATAPQLATVAVPATAVPTTAVPALLGTLPLSGLVGATQNPVSGLPSDHGPVRVALSLLVLVIAAVAAAQLPQSRRHPRPDEPLL